MAPTQKHFMGVKLSDWMEGMENFAQTVRAPNGQLEDPLGYTNFPVILLETT
jgi:hypothetical protein